MAVAVAGRSDLSRELVARLLARGDPRILQALAANSELRLDPPTLKLLTEAAKDDFIVARELIGRDPPGGVSEALFLFATREERGGDPALGLPVGHADWRRRSPAAPGRSRARAGGLCGRPRIARGSWRRWRRRWRPARTACARSSPTKAASRWRSRSAALGLPLERASRILLADPPALFLRRREAARAARSHRLDSTSRRRHHRRGDDGRAAGARGRAPRRGAGRADVAGGRLAKGGAARQRVARGRPRSFGKTRLSALRLRDAVDEAAALAVFDLDDP